MNKPNTTRLLDGYVYRWQEPDFVEIEITEVRRKSDEWKGEMLIRTIHPEGSRHLTETTHSLSVIQSRSSLARTLEDRYTLSNGARWGDYLEMACVLTVRSEREGDAFLKVGALPEDQRPDFWLLEKYIRLGHPTAIWADGATGKSTLAVLWGLAIKTGQEIAGFVPAFQGPVMWLDWESDEWDLDETIKDIAVGHNLDGDLQFDYRREVWPLTQTFRQIANAVARENIALVVLDSAGYAIGGDSEKAADVLAFTRAVRALNTSVLMIDHVKKGDTGGKAFGSAYKFNEIRLGFELMRSQQEGSSESVIGIKCRKANKGGWPAPLFLKATFGEHSIHYEKTNEIPEEMAVEALTVKDRIRRALRGASGLMNADDIAAQAATPVAQIKARLSEMAKSGEVNITEVKGFARQYSLRSNREET